MSFSRVFFRSLSILLGHRARYAQGKSIKPGTREYFYYIDHQGQLFLDDAKLKNFITCFKDKKFLAFFFRRLKLNTTGRYTQEFPYISPCGPEINFVHCDDLPTVFTHLLTAADKHIVQNIPTLGQTISSASSEDTSLLLSYGGAGDKLTVPFQPEQLYMCTDSGRVYHPGPESLGGVGLVKSSLAIELSGFFRYDDGASESSQPVGFEWRGQHYQLGDNVISALRKL